MEDKKAETRRIQPLKDQVEKIVAPAKERTALSDLLNLPERELDTHVRTLADRIRKLDAPAEPSADSQAAPVAPKLDLERLQDLLKDD